METRTAVVAQVSCHGVSYIYESGPEVWDRNWDVHVEGVGSGRVVVVCDDQ